MSNVARPYWRVGAAATVCSRKHGQSEVLRAIWITIRKSRLFAADLLAPLVQPTVFQADDEGSIPFTRSNRFNYLVDGPAAILTSRLFVILTNVRLLFAAPGASSHLPRSAAWSV